MSTEKINDRFDSPTHRRFYTDPKVGTTAGWVVRAGSVNTWMNTLPASVGPCHLVFSLDNLKEGDDLVGFNLLGQIDSGGNAVTVDAKLWEFVPAAAGSVAAALSGTDMTQLSVTTDTLMDEGNTRKLFGPANTVKVRRDRTYFALITATTLATTDIELLAFVLHINPNR